MDFYDTGKIIADLRKEKGWTQKQLAAKLCVTDKAISRWENGYGLPEVTLLPKIAAVFSVTCDELLTGKKPLSKELKNNANISPAAEVPSQNCETLGLNTLPRTPAPSVSQNAFSAPENTMSPPFPDQNSVSQILEERREDKRKGRFRLNLWQVTFTPFTIPSVLVYILLFVLLLLVSPLQGKMWGKTFDLSLLDWWKCILDKTYLRGYFSLHVSRRLETFMTVLSSFSALFLWGYSFVLLVKTARGNVGGGTRPQWIFALTAVLTLAVEALCLPFANRLYGVRKYAIPPLFYVVVVLSVLQLIFAYIVSCHKKPKKRVFFFSFGAAALTVLLFVSAFCGGYFSLPRRLELHETSPDGSVAVYRYRNACGGNYFKLPPLLSQNQ